MYSGTCLAYTTIQVFINKKVSEAPKNRSELKILPRVSNNF
jgi:hypothetical protein